MHLAAALEVQSEHPLASAVINFAAEGLGFGQQRTGVSPNLNVSYMSVAQCVFILSRVPHMERMVLQLFLCTQKQFVISGGAGKAGTSAKANQAMQGRRLDWVRPAKDVVSVAGELQQPVLRAICTSR